MPNQASRTVPGGKRGQVMGACLSVHDVAHRVLGDQTIGIKGEAACLGWAVYNL